MGDISDMTGTEDYAGITPDNGFEPLPAGWYPVEIEKAEVKPNAKNTGNYLKMQMVVLGDNYAGRKLFPMINLKHPSEECVRIGRAQVAGLKAAVGLLTLADSTELIGKMCEAKVTISKEPNNHGEYDNDVRGYRPLDGVAVQPVRQGVQQAPRPSVATAPSQAPAPTAGKRPWEK